MKRGFGGLIVVFCLSFAPVNAAAASVQTAASSLAAGQAAKATELAAQPLCPCNPCAEYNSYHRNAVRISQYYAIRGQLYIRGSGADLQHCYFNYNVQVWSTDARNLQTFGPGLVIRVWWPSGSICGVNNSTAVYSPPMSGTTLSFTTGNYFYGSCGPQADNYQTTFEDFSSNLYTCQYNSYGNSCYVNEGYPSSFPY